MQYIVAFISGIVLTVFLSTHAYAYLDPGTGSYILQVIIAALLGIAYLIKVYWTKIRVFLGNLFLKRSRDNKDGD